LTCKASPRLKKPFFFSWQAYCNDRRETIYNQRPVNGCPSIALMFRSYFTVAIRNLVRQKLYAGITVLGLAVGISGCLLISLYIVDELSYDRFHEKAGQIYRVVVQDPAGKGLALTSAPFGPALKKDYPEVQHMTRISEEGGGPVRYKEKQLMVPEIYFADPGIFDIFTYRFIEGNPEKALREPQTIILTRRLAEQLFGNTSDAVGKTVTFEGNFPNTVTGVIEDIPHNSHLRFRALRAFPLNFTDSWYSFEIYTYLLLPPGYNGRQLEAKLPQFYRRYLAREGQKEEFKIQLQPLTDIHLRSHLDHELSANGDIAYVYIFAAVAGLVLLMACINYVNLATARSAGRAKEVGVRKVVGSSRQQLVSQFLLESILMVTASLVLAVGLTQLLIPVFNAFTGKEIALSYLFTLPALGVLALLALVTGLLSGLYPALVLSRFRPVAVLKGAFNHQSSGTFFRRSLIVFQFVISVMMISSTWIIWKQLQFMNQKDLGFHKEQVLTLHIQSRQTRIKVPVIKQQLLRNPAVTAVAAASNPIGNNNIGAGGFYFEEDGAMPAQTKPAQRFLVDHDFIPAMGIQLLEGRNFSNDIKSDSAEAVIVNETLVNRLGWQEPVGKRVAYFVDNDGNTATAKVVGVVKDFHIYSLQHAIEPLVLRLAPPSEQDNLYVRINPAHTQAALSFVKETYGSFDPENPYEASFLDKNFAQQYEAEQKRGQVFMAFALLAITIACLGLFGLAAYMAEKRTKEIGIRKVMGASAGSIVTLLSRDFAGLVLIALVIAVPVAWYIMDRWLQDFAYKTDIGWWIFAGAGAISLLIALLTVSYQATKAALANPVDSLRSE
jgi:putative ABC transport system permease protein